VHSRFKNKACPKCKINRAAMWLCMPCWNKFTECTPGIYNLFILYADDNNEELADKVVEMWATNAFEA
jgi:hypothetical protein